MRICISAPAPAGFLARSPQRLEEIIYRGTNVDHCLRLADGQPVVATSTRREFDTAETEVTIGFDPKALVILED